MNLYVDHIEAENLCGNGIPSERRKVSHEAQVIASIDDVMAFIRRKIENAEGVRVLYTERGEGYYLFTPEETADVFKGRF